MKNRMPKKKIAILTAVVVLFLFANWLAALLWGKPLSISHFYLRAMGEVLIEDPELLTFLGMVENSWLDFHSHRLTDATPNAERSRSALYKRNLSLLETYPKGDVSSAAGQSYRVMHWYLSQKVRDGAFLLRDFPVNPFDGQPKSTLNLLLSSHQIADVDSIENYLSRLGALPEKVAQLKLALKEREQQGVLPPKFALAMVAEELNRFTAVPPAENELTHKLLKRLAELEGIPEDKERKWAERVVSQVRTQVYPAFDDFSHTLLALKDKAKPTIGIWQLPDGDATYANALRRYTTLSKSPNEVHQLGLSRIAALLNEVSQVGQQLGMEFSTPLDLLSDLSRNPRFGYEDSDAGRERALTDMRRFSRDIHRKLLPLWGLSEVPEIQIRRMPPALESGAPLVMFHRASPDKDRPAVLELNLRNMAEVNRLNLKTLAYHEIGGHHFQHAAQMGQTNLPLFRRFIHFSAYSEGWAMYIERLAAEQGWLSGEERLAQLQSELWRAARLVVDTGIHAKRWTMPEAVDYMTRHTGMHRNTVVTEIQRYAVFPGQACAYEMGLLTLLRLRKQWQQKKRATDSRRGFHQAVLRLGAMPLPLLEKVLMTKLLGSPNVAEPEKSR